MAIPAPKPDTPLLGCTCKRLRMATRRLSQVYDRHLEPLRLTITQYGLLAMIGGSDGVGIGALAEKLIMDPTTLTRNLRPLRHRGLVVLGLDPQDRRSRTLHLTAKGRAALDKARPLWAAAQRHIEDTLGRDDTAALHAGLARLVERLGA